MDGVIEYKINTKNVADISDESPNYSINACATQLLANLSTDALLPNYHAIF